MCIYFECILQNKNKNNTHHMNIHNSPLLFNFYEKIREKEKKNIITSNVFPNTRPNCTRKLDAQGQVGFFKGFCQKKTKINTEFTSWRNELENEATM